MGSVSLITRRIAYRNKDFIADGKPARPAMSGLKKVDVAPKPIIHANNYASLVTSAPKVVAPGNKARKRLFVQNRGTQTIFLQFGALPSGSPTFASAIAIPSGGFREWEIHCPVDDLYGVVAAGVLDQFLSIEEGVETIEYV
jgi:hypothetical protein